MRWKKSFALLLVIGFTAFAACNSNNETKATLEIGSEVAIQGLIVCLPRKGNSPATLERKFGLKVDTTYYELKNVPREAIKNEVIEIGNIVKIVGTVIETKADSLYRISAAIDVDKLALVKRETVKQNTFEGEAFSISIPSVWIQRENVSVSWSVLSSQTDGEVLTVFQTPDDFLENTNFGHTKITIGYNDEPDAIKRCLQPVDINERVKRFKVNINGITFAKISLTDAGAGNRYATNSYRVIHNSKCWAVESVLNYSPIEFYGKESGVSEFNRVKTEQLIENIIQSFRFK